MSTTLTKTDVAELDQQLSRIDRYLRHSRQLSRARASGNLPAQLEHSLSIADTRLGMAKSPADRDHWAAMHSETRALIDEAGFQWRNGHLVDPAAQAAPQAATQPAHRTFAKSFGANRANRAAEFQSLRGEIMQSIARARASGDAQSRVELCELRANLEAKAAGAGLRLDHDMRFVPAWR